MRTLRLFCLILVATVLIAPSAHAVSTNLVFDALTKEYNAKVNEATAEFDFSLTNTGPAEITINNVHASCGCTTPKLPSLPWKLAPGESGAFHVTTDLRGKLGTFQKSISFETTDGPKMIFVKISVPTNSTGGNLGVPGMDSRTRNMQLSHADRQIVFRNDCATCHAKPAEGKKGEELYAAACGVCHEAKLRAALVPDLHTPKQLPTVAYWDAWIRNGKVGTMMPAFSQEQGGPLTDEQIGSLVEYMINKFEVRSIGGKPTATAHTPDPLANVNAIGNLPPIPPSK
jgi:cytochrome c5